MTAVTSLYALPMVEGVEIPNTPLAVSDAEEVEVEVAAVQLGIPSRTVV